MNKNNVLLSLLGLFSASIIGVTLINMNRGEVRQVKSSNSPYSFNLTSSSDITSGILTSNGNKIDFVSSSISGDKINISSNGYFYNLTKISGISNISVSSSFGSYEIWYGQYVNDEYAWIDYTTSASYDLSNIYPNYFKIAATSDCVFNSITITYSCSDSYVDVDTSTGYTLYINNEEVDELIDVSSLKGDGDSWSKQYKIISDVYAGDVISFKKNDSDITILASGDGNNLSVLSNGYSVVNYTVRDATFYLKVYSNSYDVWLTGYGNESASYDIQDEAILQAWNWSISSIRGALNDIANAGFKAIQVSPLQALKDSSTSSLWSDQWYKTYQPMNFSIATNSGYNYNALGTKSELTSLCNEAEALGINIIVDVVANHLGGSSYKSFDGNVRELEPEIYNNSLYHNESTTVNDGSVYGNVYCHLGDYPDLQTESEVVQKRVLSLLKEYLDCGVKGFRFDAAKHIETPYESSYASAFWPRVINGARRYAKEMGYDDPYCYGEVLGVASDRSTSYYTPYMSITDHSQSYDVRNAVINSNTSKINSNYYAGVDTSKILIWAESHDLYKEGMTSGYSETQINQVYAIQASRSDSAVLYVARPNNDTYFGSIGTTYYKDDVVRGINEFRNKYVGFSENISVNNGCFINVRGSGSSSGAVIVNISNNNSSIDVSLGLDDGSYKDLISGNSYTVSDGSVSLSFSDKVAALVPTSLPDCYIVGNTYFTGTSESWGISSGIHMELTNENYGEALNVDIASGSEIKIYDYENDKWYGYESLGSIYSFVSDNDGNIVIEEGNYNFYFNTSCELYIVSNASSSFSGYSLSISVFSGFTNDGGVPFIYAFNSSSNEWINASSLNVTIPSKYTTFIVVRMNGSTPSWDNKWNQTEDITIDTSKSTISITDWGSDYLVYSYN